MIGRTIKAALILFPLAGHAQLAQAQQSTDCAKALAAHDAALTSEASRTGNDFSSAIAVEDAINTKCTNEIGKAQARRAALQIAAAERIEKIKAKAPEVERLVESAAKPEAYWYASYKLGEIRRQQKRYTEAVQAFRTALDIIDNVTLTSEPKTAKEKEELKEAVQEVVREELQSRQLAANEPVLGKRAILIPAKRDIGGRIGGGMRSHRGVTPTKRPLPINFDLDSADLTEIGKAAARELAQAIVEQKLSEVTLTGHTDEQGDAQYNMGLSQRRLDTVVRFLKGNGVAANIVPIPKGLTEPAQINNRDELKASDIQAVYALDRRVEWLSR